MPEINIAKKLLALAVFWNGLTLVKHQRGVLPTMHKENSKFSEIDSRIHQSTVPQRISFETRREHISSKKRRKSILESRHSSQFLDGPGRFKFCVLQRAARIHSDHAWVITWIISIIGQLHLNCFNYREVASAYSIINRLSEHPQICTFQKDRR